MKLVEEIAAAKSGLEYDFVSLRDIKECLNVFYKEFESSGSSSKGLLAIMEKSGYITPEQYSFLMEGIKEEGLRQNLNIKDRPMIEQFLGLRKDGNATTRSQDGLVIVCTHCGAKFKIKQLPKAVSKFKCGKCQKYFIFTEKMLKKYNTVAAAVKNPSSTGLSQSTVDKIIAQKGGTISLDSNEFKSMADQVKKSKAKYQENEPKKEVPQTLDVPPTPAPKKKKRPSVDIEAMFNDGAMFRGTSFEAPMPDFNFQEGDDDDLEEDQNTNATIVQASPKTEIKSAIKKSPETKSVNDLANEAAMSFGSNFNSPKKETKQSAVKKSSEAKSVNDLVNEAAMSSNFNRPKTEPQETSGNTQQSGGFTISGDESQGISIPGNTQQSGGGFTISGDESQGISIPGNTQQSGGGFTISGDESQGISIPGNTQQSGGGFTISGDESQGISIPGNTQQSGGGFTISGDEPQGISIPGNTQQSGGGFTISGDESQGISIPGNTQQSGGGFTISGDESQGISIPGNTQQSGGGFTISGDESQGISIPGNTQQSGGGFTISGDESQGISIPGNTQQSGGGFTISGDESQGISIPGNNPTDSEVQDFNTDFLKMPEMTAPQNLGEDLFDFNVTKSPTEGTSDTGTMELDANAVKMALAKQKGIQQDIQDALEKAKKLTLIECTFILRHAINFDFIDVEDAKEILEEYSNKAGNNIVAILLKEGYITKFQFNSLLENLDKDKKAGRLQKTKLTTMESIQEFLGFKENKSVVKMSCPHCGTKYKVRVNLKGGKFKCGSCKNYFFLK